MSIEIRKLSPSLAEDYAHFFDVTPHANHPEDDEKKCYCVFGCNDDQDRAVIHRYLSSRELRREYAIQNIKNNNIQGYLAYNDGEIVGWCNANSKVDCMRCYYLRGMDTSQLNELETGIRIKSIFCFLIATEMRGKGITKLLLERVCKDAAQNGFDFVEAYPKKDMKNDFRGHVEMFKKSGFTVFAETGDELIVRRPLK